MAIDWELTARTLFNQLSQREQDEILAALGQLEREPDCWTKSPDIEPLRGIPGSTRKLYVLRVGTGFRVILARRGSAIVIVDVFPVGQIEGLRSIQRSH